MSKQGMLFALDRQQQVDIFTTQKQTIWRRVQCLRRLLSVKYETLNIWLTVA